MIDNLYDMHVHFAIFASNFNYEHKNSYLDFDGVLPQFVPSHDSSKYIQ